MSQATKEAFRIQIPQHEVMLRKACLVDHYYYKILALYNQTKGDML